MNWYRFTARVAVRRVVILVVLALVGLAGLGRAHATEYANRQEAHAGCLVAAQGADDYFGETYHTPSCVLDLVRNEGTIIENGRYNSTLIRASNGSVYKLTQLSGHGLQGTHIWEQGCPPMTEWNDDLKQCFDPSQCLARNADEGFKNVGDTTRNFSSECIAGCTFKVVGPSTSVGGLTSGTFEWSGDICSANPGEPPKPIEDVNEPKKQDCEPVAGQSVCLKSNGDVCQSASTGKQFCWRPSETGQKTDGPDLQKRDAGDTPIPPSLSLPSGDTLVQEGNQVTTVTKTTDAQGNTVINATTTTVNYTTEFGTDAGDKQEGEPSDGSGAPPSGDGEDGSVTGGGECDAPPICSGDAIMCAQLAMQWRTACDVHGDADGDGQPDWTQVEGDGTEGAGEDADNPHRTVALGTNMIDQGGFLGAGQCPQLGTVDLGQFGSIDLDGIDWMCKFVTIVRSIMLLMGAFIAFGILSGRIGG